MDPTPLFAFLGPLGVLVVQTAFFDQLILSWRLWRGGCLGGRAPIVSRAAVITGPVPEVAKAEKDQPEDENLEYPAPTVTMAAVTVPPAPPRTAPATTAEVVLEEFLARFHA